MTNREQEFWETPRNLTILLVATVIITAASAGFLGFKLASIPASPPIVIYLEKPQ
jgi:hypothetical protein